MAVMVSPWLVESLEKWVLLLHPLQLGTSVLATARRLHLSAVGVAHVLSAIADAEDRVASADFGQIHFECLLVIDGERTTGENHTDDVGVVLWKFVVRENFAESVQFAHAATNELRGLRTEIENDDFLLHYDCS